MRGLLGNLGLKRRSKTLPSPGEYLATRSNGGNASGPERDERAGSIPGQATPAGAPVQG